MQTVSKQTIRGEVLLLDGKHFIDCVLIDCILKYQGTAVIFERTRLTGCRHVFYGRARGTLHYLQTVGLMPYDPSQWGELPELVH